MDVKWVRDEQGFLRSTPNYDSKEDRNNWKKFSTPVEREEYKRMVKEEARTIMNLPRSVREDHYKKAEKEYGKEHALKLVSEVKKQRQRSVEMEM